MGYYVDLRLQKQNLPSSHKFRHRFVIQVLCEELQSFVIVLVFVYFFGKPVFCGIVRDGREVQKQKKIDEEQKEVRESNETYATIAKQAVIESSKSKHNITLTSNIQIKLMALIIEAHMASLAQQEGFGTILSKSPKMNYNIDANFPYRDSAAIFKFFYNNKDPQTKQNSLWSPNSWTMMTRGKNTSASPEQVQKIHNHPSPPKDPRLHRHNTTQQERETDSMVSTLTKEQKQPRHRSSTTFSYVK
ncbi:hypothetical protein FHG87_020239 [Trinorchestia longiramus]|nr:hypothetical protein FHG87_020239 [Trinorchestia longiramus]